MSELKNYDGTALDTSNFVEEVQPDVTEETNQTDEPVDETAAIEDVSVDNSTVEPVTPTPDKYNIDGVGEFTAEQIREMYSGSMRQSDYTRKTQELAKQRDELKDAKELYDYLTANPNLVRVMQEADRNPNSVATQRPPTAETKMLRDLAYNQKAMETDMKLNELKQKYGDVDEVALFSKATELQTNDLEFVYKALKYDGSQTDERALIEKAKAELRAELESNKDVVSTTVTSKQSNETNIKKTVLSAEEKRIANAMGITESEYIKWKQ